MISYIIRRLGGSVIVLFGIALITFILAYAVPSDPARMILGQHATVAQVDALRKQMGLDEPFIQQFGNYLLNIIHGNLGWSYLQNLPVATLIGQRLPATFQLALVAWLMELIIGLPIGVFMALKDRKMTDHVFNLISLIGISLPTFFVGLELMYWVAYRANLFPVGGTGGLMYVILPGLTYGITGAAYYSRLLKSSMVDVLNSDYIRTARAKGAAPLRVIMGHAFRNAIIPVITYGATDIGALFGGIVVIEDVFGYSGIGQMAVQAISNLDTPIIMGTVLFAAVFVVAFNFIVDLLYGLIDPRITY
ncbi:ABC transporter permease [Ferroacidibacillus organovorans]|uniref:ABC transmembrane type-1 domain-containing protein n=1 Tax=Ferroacidibacillus organovorans TaxID=1765683 RepID=A0A101XQ70_9BACL|nr:ABC transporter permease [Ferroacidibacillus organovorans]KUO95456.1 hypothetical protein ATW55_03065 [Ferroacidibacillus organovorans]